MQGFLKALMYDTGAKVWKEFASYPPKNAQKINFYLSDKTLQKSSGQGIQNTTVILTTRS